MVLTPIAASHNVSHGDPIGAPSRPSKVFKYGDSSSGGATKLEIYFSFGGLLMKLVGDPSKLKVIEVDSPVYLLIRKL